MHLTQCLQGKVANLGNIVSVHCTNLLENVFVRLPCFDTDDFALQMKIDTFTLIHCISCISKLEDSFNATIFISSFTLPELHVLMHECTVQDPFDPS